LILVVFAFIFYPEQTTNFQFIIISVPFIGVFSFILYDTFFKIKNETIKILFNIYLVITIVFILFFSTVELRFVYLVLLPFLLKNTYKMLRKSDTHV